MHHRRFSLVSTWIVRSFVVLLSGWLVMGCVPCEDRDYDGFKWGNIGDCETETVLDCDDHDENIYPGATETCSDTVDVNCDGIPGNRDPACTAGCIDNDGDGYGDPASANCTSPELDCDDSNPNVHPQAVELCNGIDDNCDGLIDDVDGDGYVSPACGGDDCDDTNPDVYPGAIEICDGLDNDCDTIIPPDEIDDDGDQYVECTAWVGSDPGILGDSDCNDALAHVNPGITEGPYGEPICEDTLDNDCDGQVDGSDDGCVPPPEMAPIPEDCFYMGDAFSEGNPEELPVHNVCISGFQMDFHEVTNAEYDQCVDAGECAPPSSTSSHSRAWYYGNPVYDNFPVIYVTREQAATYCAWVGKRLPTEAEWEYAARGGLAGKRYPWGDTLSGSEANYWDSGDPWDNDTSPVGHYPPNGFGLYDVAGNVYEWVSDWLWPNYYQYCVDNGIVNDPPGPPSGSIAVARGGYWGDSADFLRLAWRKHLYPDISDLSTGFRCARGGAYGP